MKKITLLTALLLSLLFVSCARIPFEAKKPMNNAALVYVYAIQSADTTDNENIPKFKVFINGKSTDGFIESQEYKTYDLKANTIVISGAREYLERHSITLNLEAGQTHYLRLQSYGDGFGKFNFEKVDEATALSELNDTTLAGSYDTSDNVLTELMGTSDNDEVIKNNKPAMSEEEINKMIDARMAEMAKGSPVVTSSNVSSTSRTSSGSKLENIKEAYNMKKQGLLSNEEFKAMKAEILAK